MTFLSGVFFPRSQLPEWIQLISWYLPLTQSIELVRPLFLGQWPEFAITHLCVLLITAITAYLIALKLTKKRFEK